MILLILATWYVWWTECVDVYEFMMDWWVLTFTIHSIDMFVLIYCQINRHNIEIKNYIFLFGIDIFYENVIYFWNRKKIILYFNISIKMIITNVKFHIIYYNNNP